MARKATRGVIWNYVAFGAGKALTFLTIAILARLLTPNEFGIVAFATLAINGLTVFQDLGLGQALIQLRENVEEAADTVFTLNLLQGILLTALTILIAPFVSAYFQEPLVTPILSVLGLTFVLNAPGSVHTIRLQRELAFRQKLIPDLGRSIVKGVVSIGCAFAGLGVWALVFGQLAGVILYVILAWIIVPWRPRLTINPVLARRLLKFGLSILGMDILTVVTDNFDYLIIGRLFNEAALGIYTLAYRLPELLVINTLWVISAVVFPVYSSLQDQPEAMRKGFLNTVRLVELVTIPLSVGLFIVADPFVRLAFGDQWLATIPIVRLLALYALILSIGYHVGSMYQAIGRPDFLVKVHIVELIVLVPALLVGARFGLVGIAAGHIVAAIIRVAISLLVADRLFQVRIGSVLNEIKPAFISGLALTAVALPTLFLTQQVWLLPRLILIGVAGATGYLGALWFVERQVFQWASRFISFPKLGSDPSQPS